eukprot:631485-Pelagomonas_calceolata.AAC.5
MSVQNQLSQCIIVDPDMERQAREMVEAHIQAHGAGTGPPKPSNLQAPPALALRPNQQLPLRPPNLNTTAPANTATEQASGPGPSAQQSLRSQPPPTTPLPQSARNGSSAPLHRQPTAEQQKP